MYLIDTSVWIDFLKGIEGQKVRLLEALLEEGDAYLCEVTYSEICFGARDKKQFKKYANDFAALPFLKLPTDWHLEAARMGHQLKSNGHKPFLADIMIALTALKHCAFLLTEDKDFKPYQDLFGLLLE